MRGIGQLDRSQFRNFRGNFSSLGIFRRRYQQRKVEGFLDDLTSYLLSNRANIFIHFQLANRDNFQDLDKFLGWFYERRFGFATGKSNTRVLGVAVWYPG